MLLHFAGIFLLLCLAVETTRRIYRHRGVFAELGQTTAVMWLIWLCPLPLLLPLLSRQFWLLFFPLPSAVMFFIPALVVAITNRQRFDRSGDGRVKPAAAAVDQVVTFTVMGMAGMLVFTVMLWMRRQR